MSIIEWIIKIVNNIWKFISFLYKYRTVYKVCGLFATRKFSAAKFNHKYAVLVAARNEAAVIENLIDSIKNQDYPKELIDIFVVADNCKDKTADLAKKAGAICYERFDQKHCTKGYALQFLVEKIREDYGIESYEGYFIFDADNLLKKDYISRMNDAFDSGEKIITSYRNSKNFDNNWISASYAIHWLRTIRNEHRARSLFRLATRIQGTGFLFANELIRNGWNYTSLTEDRAFCADAVAMGYKISYNDAAVFYDEQPTDIRIAMRQRIRWSKGHLQAFAETGPKLFGHIFYTNGAANYRSENLTLFNKLINNIRLRFMSFDMLTVVLPKSLLSIVKKFIVYALRIVLIIGSGKVFGVGYAPEFLRNIFIFLGITPQFDSDFSAVLWLLVFALGWTLSTYFNGVITAGYIFIVENRRIIKIKWYKKFWFAITFPLFDIIGKISLVIALFARVEWKTIPHTNSTSIKEMESRHKY